MQNIGTETCVAHDETGYDAFSAELVLRFSAATKGGAKLFTTDASGLFDAFLAGFPEGAIRQHYNCHACRRFVDSFGGLVLVDEDGKTTPALWGGWAVGLFAGPVASVQAVVANAKVTGVFIGPTSPWGTPVTTVKADKRKDREQWFHMHVIPPKALANPSRKLTPDQLMAEKHEEHGMLCRGLADFNADVTARAVALLKADSLYRSEKVLGVAEWFAGVHAASTISSIEGARRQLSGAQSRTPLPDGATFAAA